MTRSEIEAQIVKLQQDHGNYLRQAQTQHNLAQQALGAIAALQAVLNTLPEEPGVSNFTPFPRAVGADALGDAAPV